MNDTETSMNLNITAWSIPDILVQRKLNVDFGGKERTLKTTSSDLLIVHCTQLSRPTNT